MSDNDATAPHPAERRQATVAYCDLVDSTTIVQRHDEEQWVDILQTFRTCCRDQIEALGGKVKPEYDGDDEVLAVFGYPQAEEDDSARAVRAALSIVNVMSRLRPYGEQLSVRIGIATGLVLVGDLFPNDEGDFESHPSGWFNAVGTVLHSAKRYQGYAAPGMVVVSDATYRLTISAFHFENLGEHILKGFDKPAPVWRVVGERAVQSHVKVFPGAELTPLVGRTNDLGNVCDLWREVEKGKGQVVVVSGEPGIGKSRLVQAAAGEVVDDPRLPLCHYCSPHLRNSALAPFIRRIVSDAGLVNSDDDQEKLDKLKRDLGQTIAIDEIKHLADLLSIGKPPVELDSPLSPQGRRRLTFEILMHHVTTLAAERPLLFIFEDLQWADPSSMELMNRIIPAIVACPVLILITIRASDELTPSYELVTKWLDLPFVHSIALRPLDALESERMVSHICGERRLPASALDRIVGRTDGNPLFIEDFTRNVLELELLNIDEATSARPLVPTTLRDALTSRLDRLGSAKELAQSASLFGREFTATLLRELSELSEHELNDALARLVAAGIVRAESTSAPATYAFRHFLVRDVAYDSIPLRRRMNMHEKVAEHLIAHHPELVDTHPELLGDHFEKAGDFDNASKYWQKAGTRSIFRSEFEEAIAHLRNSLRALETLPSSKNRTQRELELQTSLGVAYSGAVGYASDETGETYRRALQLCDEMDNPPLSAVVFSGAGGHYVTRAEFSHTLNIADKCLNLKSSPQADVSSLIGHRLRGTTFFFQGRLNDAQEELLSALECYDVNLDQYRTSASIAVDYKSLALCYLPLVLVALGYPKRALAIGLEGLKHSEALAHPHSIAFSLTFLSALRFIRGDGEDALAIATRSTEFSARQGFASLVGMSRMIRGVLLIENGDAQAGIAEFGRGAAEHTDSKANAYKAFSMSLLAKVHVAAGMSAYETLDGALSISNTTGEIWYLPEVHRLKGALHLQDGDQNLAEDSFRLSIAISRKINAKLWELRGARDLANLLETRGDIAEAREYVKCALNEFPELDEISEPINTELTMRQ